MFGLKSLVELFKGLLKLAVIGSVVTLVLYIFFFDEIFTLNVIDLHLATGKGLSTLASGVLLISVSLLIIAALCRCALSDDFF